MARMTIDCAIEILSEASRGIAAPTDAEFKVACAMGKQALIVMKDIVDKPSELDQKP